MVVVEVAPKVVLSRFGLAPVPRSLNGHVRAVHEGNVPTIGEHGEFSTGTKGRFAEIITNGITVDVQATNWVSDCDDSAGPTFVKGCIWAAVWRVVGIVIIEGSCKRLRMDDASNRQYFSARSVSSLRIAAVARHPAHIVVPFLWPDCGLEGEAFLSGDAAS